MKRILMLIGLVSLVLGACSSPQDTVPSVSFTLNGANVTLAQSDYTLANDVVYFSVPALEKYFELEFKDIIPGRQIGICRADLCIPFEVGENDQNKAFSSSGTYFVPILYLMLALGDNADWDAPHRALNVDIRNTEDALQFEKISRSGAALKHDFSLPDFDGKTVSLSDFSGKKVAVFLWAS